MKNDECRTSNAGASRWARWLLAVWEGLCFSWLLLMVYAITWILLLSDGDENLEKLPVISKFFFHLLPPSSWMAFAGVCGLGVGFGALNLNSRESLSQRVFRYVMVLSFTLFWAALSSHVYVIRGLKVGTVEEAGTEPREWVFLSISLLMAIAGIWHARHKRP